MNEFPHRYSSATFSKLASTQRTYGWIAFFSLVVALFVLTLYLFQTNGIMR